MSKAPEKIYLQWIETEYKWTNYEDDVTWCENRINDDDTVYIRSDIVDDIRSHNVTLRMTLELARKILANSMPLDVNDKWFDDVQAQIITTLQETK